MKTDTANLSSNCHHNANTSRQAISASKNKTPPPLHRFPRRPATLPATNGARPHLLPRLRVPLRRRPQLLLLASQQLLELRYLRRQPPVQLLVHVAALLSHSQLLLEETVRHRVQGATQLP